VAPPDREPPDPKRWKATTPKFGSREPLVVTFNEPIDYALGLRMIRVLNAHGSELAGSKSLVEGEQVWKFLPDEPWSAGTVELSVRSTIEDLAGNNIGRPFEVDLAEGPKPAAAPQVVKRVITIGQGGQRLQPP
jgi:hypothetical protein